MIKMWKIILLTIILLMVASPCMAIDIDQINLHMQDMGIQSTQSVVINDTERKRDWKDTTLLTMRLIDWAYTRSAQIYNIKNNYTGIVFHEKNPLISGNEFPTPQEIDLYFGEVILLDYLMYKFLHPKWSNIYKNIGIIAEAYCINNCINAEIKISF
jgi:hypothetical protein